MAGVRQTTAAPGATDTLATPLQFLKGVGPQRARQLQRKGLTTAAVRYFFFFFAAFFLAMTNSPPFVSAVSTPSPPAAGDPPARGRVARTISGPRRAGAG